VKEKDGIRDYIRQNYTKVALNEFTTGCCAGSCCCSAADNAEASQKLGYTAGDLAQIPEEANMGLGCGNPIALASLQKGETVLDLGSGGGLDCFLASKIVGENGRVIGIDMTEAMISRAKESAEKGGYNNVEFRLGEIEHLPVANASVDVVISNCVINLSPDKQQVFREIFRVLRPGGRLAISDVVATDPLPDWIKQDKALIAGCIGGAEYVEDLRVMLEEAGFEQITLAPIDNSKEIITEWVPGKKLEDFVSSYIIKGKKP